MVRRTVWFLVGFLIPVVLAFVSQLAHAGDVYTWRFGSGRCVGETIYRTPWEAVAACSVLADTSISDYTCSPTFTGKNPSPATMSCTCVRKDTGDPCATDTPSASRSTSTVANCPEPGTQQNFASSGAGRAPGQYCYGGCVVNLGTISPDIIGKGGTLRIQTAVHTGFHCHGPVSQAYNETSVPDEDKLNDANPCKTQADGSIICRDKATNCGVYNGDRVCLESVADGECKSYGSGGVVCAVPSGGVTSPPVPDNGTPGTPATPDMQVSGGSVTNNYYSSSTVAGSSTTTGTSGPAPGQGGTGGVGAGPSEETPGGGDGGEFSGPDTDETDPMSVTAAYWSRIEAAPIVAAVADLDGSVPSGTCPSYAFTVFGSSFEISAGCEFMDDIAPILEIAFLAGWSLLAVRIFISA